ncbi:neurogenic protein big brain [Chelonus insularis]|uniref:neurogenic protein big brain n=1 Tax=Chelonus insularis TaxID=460826 RepID=UPI0015897E52|nr:neurogenic protein big brain [Chelonus insularis]XP_034938557.1 neurogenic protein big brain [Chelonus insularis]
MATELSRDVDTHIVSLLTKIAALQESTKDRPESRRASMSTEARSLELWRAVAVECFATFLFSLVVLGAAASSNVYGSGLSVLATAIASGFAIAAIYLIFGHISGGHVNPAVSLSYVFSRKISPLRSALYVAAQCGGGIAGAAMLYGVTGTQVTPQNARLGGAVEKLLVEMALSILIVMAHLSADPAKTSQIFLSKSAGVLAASYTAATLVSSPYLNPARALGLSFVINNWTNHWVYWVGPIAGGALASLLHEYVLSPKRPRESREIDDGDNSSLRSDEDTYDDFDKPTGPKFPGAYATYRPVGGATSSLYSAPATAIERVESIYGGTKSLYCKSPPLTRANLNRSQSVYAKSTSPREAFVIPKPGPLVPAQSLYQMRLGNNTTMPPPTRDQLLTSASSSQPHSSQNQTQNHNSTNQNMQNQLQQCTQSIYGIRGISTSLSARENGIYGVTTSSSIYGRAPAPPPGSQTPPATQSNQSPGPHQPQNQQQSSESGPRRPESMYGHVSRRSDDSAYGSYQGSNRGNYGKAPGPPPPPPPGMGASQYRDQRPSPGPLQQNQAQNFQRNSPNPQY